MNNTTKHELEAVRSVIADDWCAIDQLICSELHSTIPLIQEISHYIVKSGGKRLRPLVLLLTARALGYANDTENHELATVIEFIHTATLLHDDVVDKSEIRRGADSANAVWGNEASILVGDFLYSRAFQILAKRSNIPIMKVLANTTNRLSEGEMWQLMNQHDPDIDEQTYYSVIQRKTAELFSAATEIAARIATEDEKQITNMAKFGLHLGMAYQIVDDLLDYSETPEILDKNIGDDLAEGKATLPLIYAKQHSTFEDAELIRIAIKQGGIQNLDAMTRIINETQARQYTHQSAVQQITQAQQCLEQLPASRFRDSLFQLTQLTINRHY